MIISMIYQCFFPTYLAGVYLFQTKLAKTAKGDDLPESILVKHGNPGYFLYHKRFAFDSAHKWKNALLSLHHLLHRHKVSPKIREFFVLPFGC